MGGKLGKKARKYAKNHLKSVLHQRRKIKSFSAKRKPNSKNVKGDEEVQEGITVEHSSGRYTDFGDASNTSLDAVFQRNEADEFGDISDSDGYLSEDFSCQHTVGTTDVLEVAEGGTGTLSVQNKEIRKELTIEKKKLDQLQKKDPNFSEFLQSYKDSENTQKDENMLSDEDEIDNAADEEKVKFFTSTAITSWCQLVKAENSVPALTCLLNAYRAACHYGAESSGHRIQDSDAFSSILVFVLSEADNTFKSQLQISLSNCKKETINQLKNNSKWKILKPLVKSYFRSTLFLLNQVVDSDILVFALSRLKASLIFFTLFPSLLHRLIKATVILWATGGEVLSSAAFHILKDVCAVFGNDHFDTCIARTFTAYIAQSRVSEISNMSHMEFMSNGIVEIFSLDVPKASTIVQTSISQLLKILQWAMQTKKKEPLNMVCSWEFVNCIDLWVKFIKVNIQEYDLHPLLFRAIQLINGIACMCTGTRYLPLIIKCVQWLNNLSTASGVFVPVASHALDSLEFIFTKEGHKTETITDFSTILKLPKSCLRSHAFQEFCLSSALEQLSVHFAQWSYHISFPELATVPLIRLRKFLDSTTNEGFRRMVKRFIDQVEHNVEFVQKRRDEAAFSPSDHQSVEMFLQLEKSGKDAPFVQYYRSILEKACLRTPCKEGKLSMPKQMQKKSKRKHLTEGPANGSSDPDSAPNAVVNVTSSESKQKRTRK